MGKSKFFMGMVVGAVVGGAITLTDRQTRNEMKIWGAYLCDLAKDRERLSSSSMEIMNRAKETARQINEDVGFIKEKVESLKDLTPEVKGLVDETKTTFLPDEATSNASTIDPTPK